MSKKANKGFSLIELMVAIVIAGIIAVVALPSYQQQIQKTRRVDAKTELTRLASLQEQYYSRENKYTDDLNGLLGVAAGTYGTYLTPNGGHYAITVVSAAPKDQFLFTATAQGNQAKDLGCAQIILDNFGSKSSKNNLGAVTTDCW